MSAAATPELLPALRARIAAIGADGGARVLAAAPARTPLGHGPADAALAGGLARGVLHEVQPAGQGDAPAATGFALACLARLAARRPWLWVRQDLAGRETGEPYGPGLAAFGLDPAGLVLVCAADARDVLRAGEEGLHCPALGAVLIEPWGDPRALDLTALRRLVLAAEQRGVAALLLRSGAQGGPAGAATRWRIAAAPSAVQPARGVGPPAFRVALERNRQPGGAGEGGPWSMEWNPDERLFQPRPDTAPGIGRAQPLAPAGDRPAAPVHRPAAEADPARRRAV